MLEFKPITFDDAEIFKKYYSNCSYGYAEYSIGTQLIWGIEMKTLWAETNGCLILKDVFNKKTYFDYPVPSENGDVDKALDVIDAWCIENEIIPAFFAIPDSASSQMFKRYKFAKIRSVRGWSDYVYKADDLQNFAGRKYSGQRNHINNFIKQVPDFEFRVLSEKDKDLVDKFFKDYDDVFKKQDNPYARDELYYAKAVAKDIGKSWGRYGGIYSKSIGGLLSFTVAEKCGNMLIVHIEKALYQYEGIYPTTVRECARFLGSDCEYINREDDANDKGLRMSKLQYLPTKIISKYVLEAENEIAVNMTTPIPRLVTKRLTLDAITEVDEDEYFALCSDKELNKYWGYDDLKNLSSIEQPKALIGVVKDDFNKKIAINFAVRLNGKMIGEVVLYNFDCKGNVEIGCRIRKEYFGNGYGAEAIDSVGNWAIYELKVSSVVAKCFIENEASCKMLASCMHKDSTDEKYIYFSRMT